MTLLSELPAAAGQILASRGASALDFLWIELTNACNLTCSHCYAGSSPTGGKDDRVSSDQYLQLISEAHALGCRKVQFIGGEATLHRDLTTFVRRCRELNFEFVEVFTNLVSLSDELLDCLKRYDVAIASSFYSHIPATHDSITGRAGSWLRTTTNLKRVVEAGLTCRVGVILMDENSRDLVETEAYLLSMGISNIGRDRIRGFGRAARSQTPTISELCGSCAGDVACIGYDGIVAPCVMSKSWPLGDLAQNTLGDILRDSRTSVVRDLIYSATYQRRDGELTMGTCNPDCWPCTPKSGSNCTPKTLCYPQHSPNCSPKY